jgi:hypothetical protein
MIHDTPDPVSAPDAYRRTLLGLLGQEDPAEVQRQTGAIVRNLIKEAGSRLKDRPAPGEWSVLELVGHLADAELVVGGRYRWALAHDNPPLIPYDQDLWVERLRHNDDDPAALLAQFDALRTANLDLWERTPAEEKKRAGLHAERGPESFETMFRMLAGHDRFHLEQMRKTLAQLGAAKTGSGSRSRP